MEPASYRTRHHPLKPHYPEGPRQGFYQPRTSLGSTHHARSLGAAGHLLHLLSVAAPLVIAETIKDPDRRWRAMRGVTVGTAILAEAVWTLRISQDRKREAETRRALESCEERCP